MLATLSLSRYRGAQPLWHVTHASGAPKDGGKGADLLYYHEVKANYERSSMGRVPVPESAASVYKVLTLAVFLCKGEQIVQLPYIPDRRGSLAA